MLPLCRDQGIAVIPWSPLGRGLLTRRPASAGSDTPRAQTDAVSKGLYTRDDDRQTAERVSDLAEARGLPNAQVALAWLLARPGVTAPIIGASKPHHLEDAVAALDVTLSAEETRLLEEPYQPHPVLGFQ